MQRQQQELRRLLAKDPKPGQVMDVPAVDLSGKPLPSGEKLSLVFVGRVNRHNREHILKWLEREPGRTNAKWVVVAIGEEDDLQAIQRASGKRFQVVSDVKGRLHTRWNAVVLPRVYEVDSTGKLRLIRRPERGCGGCTGRGGDPDAKTAGFYTSGDTLAIIAVLAALTISGVQYAVKYAHRSTCISNLRQLVTALKMYDQNWGGPPPLLVAHNTWDKVQPEIKPVLLCPADFSKGELLPGTLKPKQVSGCTVPTVRSTS